VLAEIDCVKISRAGRELFCRLAAPKPVAALAREREGRSRPVLLSLATGRYSSGQMLSWAGTGNGRMYLSAACVRQRVEQFRPRSPRSVASPSTCNLSLVIVVTTDNCPFFLHLLPNHHSPAISSMGVPEGNSPIQ
jgi:hypothetical protein